MSSKDFKISMRIFHPTRRGEDIVKHVPLEFKIMQSVGDDRRTPKGNELEGAYDRTYISFDLPEENGETLEDVLRRVLKEKVMTNPKFFEDLFETGGSTEFFIGIFCRKSLGIEIGMDIIDALALTKIVLSIDFYGEHF